MAKAPWLLYWCPKLTVRVTLDDIQTRLGAETDPAGFLERLSSPALIKAEVAHIFLAVEPLIGKRRVWVRENHTQLELAEILKTLVLGDYPNVEKVVLVADNLSTHALAVLAKTGRNRFVHFGESVSKPPDSQFRHSRPRGPSVVKAARCPAGGQAREDSVGEVGFSPKMSPPE